MPPFYFINANMYFYDVEIYIIFNGKSFLFVWFSLYPELVKLTYGLYVIEGSTTFRQFRSIKVLCLAKSDPSTMLYITVHNSYLHLWSTGQLFGFP